MKPIAIFYHCLFQIDDRELPAAIDISVEQMAALESSGLVDACSELIVGVNGGEESRVLAEMILPRKSKVTYHGLQCHNELRTLLLLEEFVKTHPDWYVLYHHAKNATHSEATTHGSLGTRWRRCMERTCVHRWRECVAALDQGFEAVGAHWMTGQGWDRSQHYFAGTFYWATSNFMRMLPSITKRERIILSGLDSAESRYEAEVAIGNGPRLPRIKDMETTHAIMACP